MPNDSESPDQPSPGLDLLKFWLGIDMRIVISDGRILIGKFACTDRDGNVILKECYEYNKSDDQKDGLQNEEEPRPLGLAMVPGRHIKSVSVSKSDSRSPPSPIYLPI